ncbi:MAG: MarR family winged helix-turn-helix transcriptional regulator [Intrasporangiaceae bacterium]|nr:MarR family winged helix-turn-helix transcriptional regulator [Intrasporangiaceae bacterium]
MSAHHAHHAHPGGQQHAPPATEHTEHTEHTLESALMAVARGLRHGWAESIAHTGLAPHRARALRMISAEGPLRPGTLADRLRIAPRSVTEVVDALVERDLVRREPDPTDRRAMTLTITDAGRELVGEITAIRRAHTEQVFDAVLSGEEQDALGVLLGRLAERLAP